MVGWSFLGVDGGYLLAVDTDRLRHGLVVRPFVTLGVVALYYRFGIVLKEQEISHDLGLLVETYFPLGPR